MKTIIIILVIISLIFLFNCLTVSFFEKETAYYNDEIFKIIDNINQGYYKEAKEQISYLNTHWEKRKKTWNMLCDHSEVEEISVLMNASKTAFEHKEYFSCITALETLDLSLKFAGDRYSLLVENIS